MMFLQLSSRGPYVEGLQCVRARTDVQHSFDNSSVCSGSETGEAGLLRPRKLNHLLKLAMPPDSLTWPVQGCL